MRMVTALVLGVMVFAAEAAEAQSRRRPPTPKPKPAPAVPPRVEPAKVDLSREPRHRRAGPAHEYCFVLDGRDPRKAC